MFDVKNCKQVVELCKPIIEEYENCPPTEWGGSKSESEKIFLSPELVEGFPENIDYMKEWRFK